MKLFTKVQYEQLIQNGKDQDGTKDFQPVVKLFTPDANCTWLISEIDPENNDIAFGLCDLGMGCAEMGSVSIEEITAIRGQLNLPIERDRSFKAIAPLTMYWRASQAHQRIVESPTVIKETLLKHEAQKEAELQRKVGEFVERKIAHNISSLIEHHVKTDEQFIERFTHLLFQYDEQEEPGLTILDWTLSCEIYRYII